MFQKESILQMKVDTIREFFEDELTNGIYCGVGVSIKQAAVSARILEKVVDVPQMVTELAALLQKYKDFRVESKEHLLHVRGVMKGEATESEPFSRLWLQYWDEEDEIVVASVDAGDMLYCTQLEFLDNLAGVFGVQLALLIQDDEEMKRFYLEYLEWLEPYYEQGMEKKQSFSKILAHSVGKLAMQYPEELATIMPKGFNVPYFVNRLRHILEAYHLPDINAPSEWKLMGFTITRDDVWLSCHIDFRTFNGLMILFGTDERVEKPRVLNEKQVVQMAENLLLLMLQTDDTVSRLFAKDLSNVIAEMLKLGTDTDPAAAAEALQKYVEVFYF